MLAHCTYLSSYDCFTRDSIRSTADIICISLCDQLVAAIRESSSSILISHLAIEAREYLWDALHSKCWKDISPGYRNAFGWVSLIVAKICLPQQQRYLHISDPISNLHDLKKMKVVNTIEVADTGILLGSDHYRKDLQQLIKSMEKEKNNFDDRISKKSKTTQVHMGSCEIEKTEKISEAEDKREETGILRNFLLSTAAKLKRSTILKHELTPNLLLFYEKFLILSCPVVLTGCVEDWPALDRWINPEYLIEGILS
jgi:hypothetical protein